MTLSITNTEMANSYLNNTGEHMHSKKRNITGSPHLKPTKWKKSKNFLFSQTKEIKEVAKEYRVQVNLT